MLTEICPETKNAEFTSNQVFLGINKRKIFKLDPRVPEKSPEFTSFAVNDEGHMATGSQNGEIRLYKEVGQNAKNLYQGLGGKLFNES
jgi:hypothetical protein